MVLYVDEHRWSVNKQSAFASLSIAVENFFNSSFGFITSTIRLLLFVPLTSMRLWMSPGSHSGWWHFSRSVPIPLSVLSILADKALKETVLYRLQKLFVTPEFSHRFLHKSSDSPHLLIHTNQNRLLWILARSFGSRFAK